MGKKRLFSSYLSKEVAEMADFLTEREEVSKVVFVRRAIRFFMEGDHKVDERLRITEKTKPNYIKRGIMYNVYMEDEQRQQLKLVAQEENCTLSQVFFQVMIDYCVWLIDQNDEGIVLQEGKE